MTVRAVFRFELFALLTELASTSLAEVMLNKLPREFFLVAAWWEERLIFHALVVEILKTIVAVVIAARGCDDLGVAHAICACRALDGAGWLRNRFDAVLPFIQTPSKCLESVSSDSGRSDK